MHSRRPAVVVVFEQPTEALFTDDLVLVRRRTRLLLALWGHGHACREFRPENLVLDLQVPNLCGELFLGGTGNHEQQLVGLILREQKCISGPTQRRIHAISCVQMQLGGEVKENFSPAAAGANRSIGCRVVGLSNPAVVFSQSSTCENFALKSN